MRVATTSKPLLLSSVPRRRPTSSVTSFSLRRTASRAGIVAAMTGIDDDAMDRQRKRRDAHPGRSR